MFSVDDIRYINGSTSLPVDPLVRRHLEQAITPDFMGALDQSIIRHTGGFGGIDVVFVSAKNLENDRFYFDKCKEEEYCFLGNEGQQFNTEDECDEKINLESLGIFCTEHPYFGRQIIQISPERVFLAAIQLQKKLKDTVTIEELYPELLTAMIIYGLACWFMDENDQPNGLQSCLMFAKRYDKDPTSGRDALNKALNAKLPNCYGKWAAIPTWYYAEKLSDARIVEKSLATSVMLKQNWSPNIQQHIAAFVGNAALEYMAGLSWQLSLAGVLSTARSWKEYKWALLNKEDIYLPSALKDKTPTRFIAEKLSNAIIDSEVDFCRYYVKFIHHEIGAYLDEGNIEDAINLLS